MIPDASGYATLIFDCDGVVLDSNLVKTEAFRTAAAPWGEPAAEALVAHHIANGGVSRYVKFVHFLDRIVPEHAPGGFPGRQGPDLEALLAVYAEAVRSGLMSCAVASALRSLRTAAPETRWLIVSGGDQEELSEIFSARGLADHFDGGIFGSPDTKDEILLREIRTGNIRSPALFLGDSRLDYEAATRAGLDFVFVADWSEWTDGPSWAAEGKFPMVKSLSELGKGLP